MPLANQELRTATKGLITERQGLVFPPDASVDELNCTLDVDGIRRRRKGLTLETSSSLSSFTVTQGTITAEATWKNVGGVPSLEFLVVQVGDTLYFYDKSTDPISSGLQTFSIDLNTFDAGNNKEIDKNNFQGDSLDGVFVVTHPSLDPFFITYDSVTKAITNTKIVPKVRDFKWQGDPSTYRDNISTATVPITVSRDYDTRNSGWDDTDVGSTVVFKPLASFISSKTAYPALTHTWYSGKDANDLFSNAEWDKVYSGTSLISNGHYILDFFSKNRESILTGAGIENETSRFKSVAAFAGRFWYAGLESALNGGRILFTKTIESSDDYGFCHQQHDPTSEIISDLLDTDGGVLNIPEAYGIKKLFAFGPVLVVFAENGIWQIKGVDDVFKATGFSVSKLATDVGIVSDRTFVDAGGIPFWWSQIGIHTIVPDKVSGDLQESNISKGSIQTFWDDINTDKKLIAKGAFDGLNQTVVWMFPNENETINYKYNRFLILDLNLQAFLPWTVSDEVSSTSYIVGMSFFSSVGSVGDVQNVTQNGELVTENSITVTWDAAIKLSTKDNQVKFLIRDGATGKLTFALFGDSGFLDWNTVDYSSYAELGYNFFKQLTVKKSPLYVVTYFERTEDGYVKNTDDSYSLKNPSSCKMKVFWDFKNVASSDQQVYRLKNFPFVDENDLTAFAYGTSVIINRTKIKGRGRVVNLKFESEKGKDFRFMGFEITGIVHEGL